MTMRMSADDQFKFLLSCVKWSVSGKVDFQEVAAECNVVSKGAAAKRYERMLKNHGIHPNGGPLDSSPPPREKIVAVPKVPKKRKCEDVIGTVKQDEDEERKPLMLKRSRNEQQHEIKQEPSHMPYPPPYMFHPMMPPHGSYQPRLMPPYMHPGLPHGQTHYMQHPPHLPQPPYPMMPGMHNNHQFMMPHHQMQSFPTNQNIPPQPHDSSALGSFDDFCNQDFGNASFETLLHGDPAGTRPPNEAFQSETPSVPQESLQTSIDLQPENVSRQIKAEPCQSLNSPASGSDNVLVPVSLSIVDHSNDLPMVTTTVEADRPASSSTPIEAIHHPRVIETKFPFKQEDDPNCIFISD